MNTIQRTDEDESTTDVPVTYTERESHAVVRVIGDSRGVPDKRKDTTLARNGKGLESRGTGLGPCLMQSLVEECGSDVRVEDNDPSGSVFAVEPRPIDGGQPDSDQSSLT